MGLKTPITIAKAIAEIANGNYVLPSIQREFVWDAEQIEKLFDSLLKGYPVGSFLFWEVKQENLTAFQFYRFMDHYHQRDNKHNPRANLVGRAQGVTAVLDGQQRLTALNISLRGTYADKLPYYRWDSDHAFPKRRLYLNLMTPSDELEFAYEFRMLRPDRIKVEMITEDEKFWFPVGKVLEFDRVADAFNYCVKHGLTAAGDTFPSDTLLELWHVIRERETISYFQEEEQDLDRVLNIFIRVNSGGTQLSYSDMLLSIATAQWEHRDARQEIHDLVDDLNQIGEGFQFHKDFVLKASLVLSDIRTIEFKVNNFNRENMLSIESQWDGIQRTLRLTARLLASWGFSWQTLVSYNAVIPLAYYIYRIGAPANLLESAHYKDDREHMVRWLRMALLKRTFGGQPDSVLRPLRQTIADQHEGFPFQAILGALRGTAKSMDFTQADLEGLLGYRYRHNYTFSVLSMLYPWLKYNQHFHMDHIYPRSMFHERQLSKHNIPVEDWAFYKEYCDSLANLQLLKGLPNQEKSDQEFEAWLQGSCDTPADLEHYRRSHLIPDVALAFANFPAFIRERERLILEKLAELLDVKLDPAAIKLAER